MAQTFKGAINFPTNFDVQTTRPLDARLVVDSIDDLTNGSITSPYQGMVVSIKGTSELWILKTQGIEASHNIDNWGKVSGDADGESLNEIKESLGILSDLVGTPEESDEATGLFKEINDLKKGGVSSTLGYTIPMMTPEMAASATADPMIDFDEDSDPYLLTDYDADSLSGEITNNIATSINGTYLDVMLRAIRSLQMEVAKLKNSFTYGIDSYDNLNTAKSVALSDYADATIGEPLWAIDPGYLSEVEDSSTFNTYLDQNHTFTRLGDCTIDVSVEGQLTFNGGKARFSDGDENGENLTLYKLSDSKLITYLVTSKPDITMTLVSLDDKSETRTVDFSKIMNGNTVNKYGFCVVVSRKVQDSTTKTYKGFNYIYFSIINYETDKKLYEGYLNSDGTLSDTRIDLDERYSIQSLTFDMLTLYRMKFYTKYEDFSEEVISSAPSECDYKYEVAHITIRAVDNTSILNEVKEQLKDNELVWNKKNKTLHIKSDGKMYLIGANTNVDPEDSDGDSDSDNNNNDNNNDNMTNKEILTALQKMGLVINVTYVKDSNGNDTDEIASVSDMSLAPISDFTFVNGDTGKAFTFTVDNEGNLVGKDKSAETIAEFIESLNSTDQPDYDKANYQAVRGFSSDYLFRKNKVYTLANGVNSTGDAGKKSDRLRISSFYAPINTDTKHGCTHSFIELENTSDIDIPLTGVYLHFYSPVGIYDSVNDTYSGKVYHLALDGVVPAGGTYLIRGAQHAQFDDESAFIKVKTYDKEWYYNKELLSFEQEPVKTTSDGTAIDSTSIIKTAYRFCLTYGLPELDADTTLAYVETAERKIESTSYDIATYPNTIVNPRFIDSCSFSTLSNVAKLTNPWYINGTGGTGIIITENTMFRLMFALDPAKQAFNGFNTKDGSRVRYNKDQDIQILDLSKEFIGYPHSNEIIKIERFTPKASFDNRNVMTDKTQLDFDKPNMVTCSFGNDVYNTRCFNWISCGTFDEYLWVRKQGDTTWSRFQSYTTVSADVEEGTGTIHRKEYSMTVNNAAYARMINRFPGNNVLFTAHKCVIVLPDATDAPVTYEYVVGRPDKDNNPDTDHVNDTYTFTVYPRTYEGRVYQVTDQQGFHWIEYQVWAASAEYLNTKIASDMASATNEFPILLNTGDMTQSGARINEWLDYYNAGKSLFSHMEQMNCVGNNDLCPTSPNDLGTGNDSDKSNSHFFHYFYCFDVKDTDRYNYYASESDSEEIENAKFFSGETLVIKKDASNSVDRYIPSFYYFKTKNVMYVMVNSEIPTTGCNKWFGLHESDGTVINIYTGIEVKTNGNYNVTTREFTPLYETMYAWLKDNSENGKKKIVVAMHEMPFTVITQESLTNSDSKFLRSPRNFPNGKTSRVGSNTNQLDLTEDRGTYWFSRLLEYFGCKLVIGGHKHTYALTYPIKEKYTWAKKNADGTYGTYVDSLTQVKPMSATLEDEAGENPEYMINWIIDYTDDNPYGISTAITTTDGKRYNSTKAPYIPSNLYNGKTASSIVRCCTPVEVSTDNQDDKYDGFITYSMCQATGYKLKSNKELPSELQVFSKIIPKTTYTYASDGSLSASKPNANQLYPMYSVLIFSDDCSELDVKMIRIKGVFAANGKDTFTQSSYGKGALSIEYLCSGTDMYGKWVATEDTSNKYLHIKF